MEIISELLTEVPPPRPLQVLVQICNFIFWKTTEAYMRHRVLCKDVLSSV